MLWNGIDTVLSHHGEPVEISLECRDALPKGYALDMILLNNKEESEQPQLYVIDIVDMNMPWEQRLDTLKKIVVPSSFIHLSSFVKCESEEQYHQLRKDLGELWMKKVSSFYFDPLSFCRVC